MKYNDYAFVITFTLLFMAAVQAQETISESEPDDTGEMAAAFVSNILVTLFQSAPETVKPKFKDVDYTISNSADPMVARARLHEGIPVIEISTGAFNLLANLAYGSAASVFIEDGPKKYADWTLDVGKRVRDGDYSYSDFLTFTDAQQPENEYFQQIFAAKLTTSLSYIVAHESSHIILGHLNQLAAELTNEQLQAIEYEADDLAVELLAGAAGDDPTAFQLYGTGYLEFFMFGMQLNRDILGHQSLREHPPEPERSVRMARKFQVLSREKFADSEELALLERAFNDRIQEHEMYMLILEYQNYLYEPDSENISLEEWRRRYKK